MKWKSGDVYLCCNPGCECEVTLNVPPRPTGTAQLMPSCCACGNPMYKKEAPEVQPTQPN